MDIFKFLNPNAPTHFEQGQILNGFTSKLWIERYRDAGEFKLVAPLSTGMKDKLPIGTFISHPKSTELMIVENHEISGDVETNRDIVITGRGFETYFEQRVVGNNKTFPIVNNQPIVPYTMAADYSWAQVISIVNDHTNNLALVDPLNAIPRIRFQSAVAGGIAAKRPVDKGTDLYSAIIKLLEFENLGIMVIRPGFFNRFPWNQRGPIDLTVTTFYIHKGGDRSDTVSLSYATGDITNADYLWSSKKRKNCAYIISTHMQSIYTTPGVQEFERRWMYVDGSDIDNDLVGPPIGPEIPLFNTLLQQRGQEVLANQNDIALAKADASRQAQRYTYRNDYNLGDLVTVVGEFGESAKMRVTEFAEVEDENGEQGYPTLSSEDS